jgi:hypothetical protein
VDVDPWVPEVMTALEAVTFCREASFFEGDALQVVKVIDDTSPNLSRIGHFVE